MRGMHIWQQEKQKGRGEKGKEERERANVKERQRDEIDKGTQKCHSVPLETFFEGSLLFIYFLRIPKQETSPALKAARKSATGPMRKQHL